MARIDLHRGLLLSLICCFLSQVGAVSSTSVDEAFQDLEENLRQPPDAVTVVAEVDLYAMFADVGGDAMYGLIEKLESQTGSSPTDEVKQLLKRFSALMSKLDALDEEAKVVKRILQTEMIDFNVAEYERSIHIVLEKLRSYLFAPPAAAKFYKAMFLERYILYYQNAASKILVALTSDSQVIHDNLLAYAKKRFGDDRAALSKFAGYMFRILSRGILLEYSFTSLRGSKAVVREVLVQKWRDAFERLRTAAAKVDTTKS